MVPGTCIKISDFVCIPNSIYVGVHTAPFLYIFAMPYLIQRNISNRHRQGLVPCQGYQGVPVLIPAENTPQRYIRKYRTEAVGIAFCRTSGSHLSGSGLQVSRNDYPKRKYLNILVRQSRLSSVA